MSVTDNSKSINNNNYSSNQYGRKTGGLQRFCSEQSLTNHVGMTPKVEARKRSQDRTHSSSNAQSKPMRKTTSQPQLGKSSQGEDVLNAQNLRRLQGGEHVESNDEEDEEQDETVRNERIIQWLIGVETSAEKPPSPAPVVEDGPTQTDTAIHIVYEES